MPATEISSKLARCLLLLRLAVGLVFVFWTVDKFINPAHAAAVFEKFYWISGIGPTASYLIGGVEMLLIIAFLAGAWKTYSYLGVFLLHLVSTASSYAKYLDPWTYPNLLFFAAIPMLAACWALWSLREHDVICSVDAYRAKPAVKHDKTCDC